MKIRTDLLGKKRVWLWAAAGLLSVATGASGATKLPLRISPYNHDIRYVGRFDNSQAAGPRCAWSASEVTIRFRGTAAEARLAGGTNQRWQIIVDRHLGRIITLHGRPAEFLLASHLKPGVHTISIFRLGEPIWGTTRIMSFRLSTGSRLLPMPDRQRHLEVIGDSISAGFGVTAPNQTYHFSPTTENAYLAYGAVAARALHAEYVCIAWSGKCLWPKNTIPKIYGRVLPNNPHSRWNYAWKPQVIVINLGTNDFAGGNPQARGWINAYVKFIKRLRKHDPGVTIFCALSPMLTNPWSPSKDARSTCHKYLLRVVARCHRAGYRKVYFLDFPMQTGKYGFGAQWHPSVGEQHYMGEILVRALRKKMGW
jgi:lysophospholipase L1-like esterase